MMKDEAPYLLEWFAHHLAVGFTDILVYTNDCSDGTDKMLMRLQELGLGHHRRNIIREGIKPQPSAIKHAQVEPIVQNSDWVLIFDADEFLCISHGDGTIDGMISAAGDANGIVITWRTFGSNNVVDWCREPVTEQYQHAAPANWNKGWGVKTLFRFDAHYWKLGIHRPSMKAKHLKTGFPDTVHWLNGSGLPMEDYFKFRGWRSIRRTVGYDWAQMNHYAVKGIDAYAIRKFRGNVNNKKDKYNADYWSLQDRNEVKDTGILRYRKKRQAIVTELLKDPMLNKLHFKALERIEARLEKYKKTKAYEKLKTDLLEASKVPIAQVVATPPKARDPSKIASKMSDIERKTASQPKEKRQSKSADLGGSVYVAGRINRKPDVMINKVANHDVQLPVDPRVFSTDALDDIAKGKFDRRAARIISSLVGNSDRLLDVGAGVSFIACRLCLQYPGLVVMTQDERKDLAQVAREIATDNGIGTSRLKIIDSSLFFASDTDAQASGLKALIRDFNPTVLRINSLNITPDILKDQDLAKLRRLIFTEAFASGFDGAMNCFDEILAGFGLHRIKINNNHGPQVFDRKPE